MTSGLRRSLQGRLAEFLGSWPAPVGEELARYFRTTDAADTDGSSRRAEPDWCLLPRWLLADPRFASNHSKEGTSFLADILWGQYCLFLFVRLHDDLLDDQSSSASLVFAGDTLLMESERAFARHLESALFWRLYRECVEKSIRAILEVDALQRRPGAMDLGRARLYADVDAIFKVGPAAVCIKCRRTSALTALSSFGDELAIAGQIIDDLEDVDQDLARQRFNVAANCLGITADPPGAETAARLTRRVLLDDAIGSLAADVERHLDLAAEAIAQVGLRPATAYVNRLRRQMKQFTKALHRTRVEYVLGSCLPT